MGSEDRKNDCADEGAEGRVEKQRRALGSLGKKSVLSFFQQLLLLAALFAA